jgi:hypothetical protein
MPTHFQWGGHKNKISKIIIKQLNIEVKQLQKMSATVKPQGLISRIRFGRSTFSTATEQNFSSVLRRVVFKSIFSSPSLSPSL